jgi:hypothetical protein
LRAVTCNLRVVILDLNLVSLFDAVIVVVGKNDIGFKNIFILYNVRGFKACLA